MKTWQKVAIGTGTVALATYLLWRLWPREEEGGAITTDAYGNGYPAKTPPIAPYERPPGSGTPTFPSQGFSNVPGMPQAMDLLPGDLGGGVPGGMPGTVPMPSNPAGMFNQSLVPNTLSGGSPQPIMLAPSRTVSRRGGTPCPPGMYWNDAVGGCMNE